MKYLLATLLLGLAARPALAGPPPAVPATLDVAGLHLHFDANAQRLIQLKVSSLCRHQPSLEARVALAEAAFPLIDRVLAEEGVPADFRYLVLQESALQGNATSPHGAVGYWQLKAETARELGLTVNDDVDERQHLTASTRAAARYLLRHQASVHNWANALLCYNLGATGARRYLAPTDADAGAMFLTAGSSPYLLDFVAQKLVFEPACASGAVPFVPWREVPAAPGQTLAALAATLQADPAAVAQLNPWLLAPAVPHDGRAHTLLVPLTSGAAALPPHPSPADAELVAGRSLPAKGPTPPAVASAPTAAPAAPAGDYTVLPGENLYGLARRQGVTPAELAAWNGLPADTNLRAGQLLRLGPPTPAVPVLGGGFYVVTQGDTFYNIARRYHCTVEALRAHNERLDLTLHVGEQLRVPLY